MKLQEFISQALQDIVRGVLDAQNALAENGKHINPQPSINSPRRLHDSAEGHHIQDVNFDVAVTAVEKEGSAVGIGVLAAAFNLGAQAQTFTENAAVSRIKFTVGLTLPHKSKNC